MADSNTPDVYADEFEFFANVWGVTLTFSAVMPTPDRDEPLISVRKALVRMSLPYAKVMAMAIRKGLKQWEEKNGAISIPKEVYERLELSPKEW